MEPSDIAERDSGMTGAGGQAKMALYEDRKGNTRLNISIRWTPEQWESVRKFAGFQGVSIARVVAILTESYLEAKDPGFMVPGGSENLVAVQKYEDRDKHDWPGKMRKLR